MVKPTAIVFGAGAKCRSLLPAILKHYDVIAFVDNDSTKWGEIFEGGTTVCDPKMVIEADFDMVVIATYVGLVPMTEQLLSMGVNRSKIDRSFVATGVESRILFLERMAQLLQENNIVGCVAEGGVFQGEFAKEINRVFPESTLYLFDTFTGFDARDVGIET